MVPPSFTPDSRLPPHQQHRKQMHFLYTDGICLFIARHVNVCQSVAAYLLLTACIHPSGISPPDARYAVMCSVRSSEMYSPYAGSCASHQPAAFCFPRISLLVLFQAFFLYLLPILLHHPRFCQGLFRIRSASSNCQELVSIFFYFLAIRTLSPLLYTHPLLVPSFHFLFIV